jgi:hypothetical protein
MLVMDRVEEIKLKISTSCIERNVKEIGTRKTKTKREEK